MTPDATATTVPPFRVLYVCVGNLCRSVLAERLTRLELDRHPAVWAQHFEVGSAGTRGRDGDAMHPYTASLLLDWSADTGGFAARRLTPALLRDTDLVLTATGRERDDVVGMLPATLRRTFTVNEFSRLAAWLPESGAGGDPVRQAREAVTAALALRGRVPVGGALAAGARTSPDDLPDPARTPEAFRECGVRVEEAVRTIVQALRGAAAPRPVATPRVRDPGPLVLSQQR